VALTSHAAGAPMYLPDPRHATLGNELYDVVEPAEFPRAVLRYRNRRWARRIGLDGLDDDRWVEHFARFRPLPDNLQKPLALRYHGHQFQNYNPELGDGRGFLFAQVRDPEDNRLLDLATKGSGRTPWSRRADGRLTLKGGVREVLAAEMLEALGVYTSKAFSLIETGEELVRHDEPSPTRSCVLVRLGHSHIRIGSFQRLAYQGNTDALSRLLNYSVATYWPEFDAPDTAGRAVGLLRAVTRAVARMGAEWTVAGFVHGVLNTDNVVITGESFDYGPWRFLPTLEPGFTAAYFDRTGLYAFGRQPDSLDWNLHRLAECFLGLAAEQDLHDALAEFMPTFEAALMERTLARLGLSSSGERSQDARLTNAFYKALADSGLPFERAFFDLVGGARGERIADSPHADVYASDAWRDAVNRLRQATPVNDIDTVLDHPYFRGNEPTTLLVDEVESLWAAIAEFDDWEPLRAKLAAIDTLRQAYAHLLGEPNRGAVGRSADSTDNTS
jgi:uncharacterized protein YdiU (UPF0061 family)